MTNDPKRHSPRPAEGGGKSTHNRFAVALLLLLALVLAACNTTKPSPDPDPDPDPPELTLTAPAEMIGVSRASVSVQADGSWQLRVVEPAMATRVSLSRSSGSGNASLTLTVDYEGLSHVNDYLFTLELRSGSTTRTRQVLFAFPSVTGQTQRAVGGTALPEGRVHPLATLPEPAGQQAALEAAGLGADIEAAVVAAAGADGMVTLLVGLEPARPALAAQGLDATPAATAVSSLSLAVASVPGAVVESRFDEAGLAFVEVPAAEAAAAIQRLQATPGVRYAELPAPIYPLSNDEYRHLQWNLDTVRAEAVWPEGNGAGVTIAVLDNGLYPDHPDLVGNVVGQYDAGDERNTVYTTRNDCGTHGTHVAGIAAAVANNNIGVAGAAPGAWLYLVDLGYDDRPQCGMNAASLVRGIQHIVNGGSIRAEVMNLSIGSAGHLEGVQDALQAAVGFGIIVVGAAGNTQCVNGRPTNSPISYPAAYEEVWAVGATGPSNERACYSHVGSAEPGGPELFIAAPGGDGNGPGERFDTIYSTDYDVVNREYTYGWMQGTSMASPLVAGVVALLKSAVPSASNDDIRDAIIATAQDLGSPGFDPEYGHGLINAAAAYDLLSGDAEPPLPDPDPPPPPPIEQLDLVLPELRDVYPISELDDDGLFTITNAPLGQLRVTVGHDANGNGTYGEPGELYGEAVVNVRFDQPNTVVIHYQEVPGGE